MVFCNLIMIKPQKNKIKCHNPYFNRWFSAMENIQKCVTISNMSQSLF